MSARKPLTHQVPLILIFLIIIYYLILNIFLYLVIIIIFYPNKKLNCFIEIKYFKIKTMKNQCILHFMEIRNF